MNFAWCLVDNFHAPQNYFPQGCVVHISMKSQLMYLTRQKYIQKQKSATNLKCSMHFCYEDFP